MRPGFLFIFMMFSFHCFAKTATEISAEAKINNYRIDWKYNAGEYLIFDCAGNHYACVNFEGNDKCKEERRFAREIKAIKYPCAPLKKFEDKISCVQKNYQVVDTNAIKRFCYPE